VNRSWAQGIYDPAGYDDELVCEPAAKLPFKPPPKRQDVVQAVRAPAFVHQISGRQTPNSPFYFGPTTERTKRDPVARMAAAAPWAAARPERPGGALAAARQPAKAAAPPARAAKAKALPPRPAPAAAVRDGVPDVAPPRPAANNHPIGAGFPVKAAPQKAFKAPVDDEDYDYFDDEEDDEGDYLDEYDEVPPLPARAGKQVAPALQPHANAAKGQQAPFLSPQVLSSLPVWLQDQLRTSGQVFESQAALLAWLRRALAERPRTPAQARKRTNAERFALDLPPLPPVNQRKKERPGDAERQRQRERRMELEELRAKAELQAFREGRDPDEAIAAVRLPPLPDEAREKALTDALEKATIEASLDALPADLGRALRGLVHSAEEDAVDARRGQQHVLGAAAADKMPFAGAAPPRAAQPPRQQAPKPALFMDEEDEDLDDVEEEPVAVVRKGPLAAQQKRPAEVNDENAEDALDLEALSSDDQDDSTPPSFPERRPGRVPAPVGRAAAGDALPREQRDARAPPAGKPLARAGDGIGGAGQGDKGRRPVVKEPAVAPAKAAPAKAPAKKASTPTDAIAAGQPFVQAMQDALGPEAWSTFLAALRAGGGIEPTADVDETTLEADEEEDVTPAPPAQKLPLRKGKPPAVAAPPPVQPARAQAQAVLDADQRRKAAAEAGRARQEADEAAAAEKRREADAERRREVAEEEAAKAEIAAAERRQKEASEALAAARARLQNPLHQHRQAIPPPPPKPKAPVEAAKKPAAQKQVPPKPAIFDPVGAAKRVVARAKNAAADAVAYEANLARNGKVAIPYVASASTSSVSRLTDCSQVIDRDVMACSLCLLQCLLYNWSCGICGVVRKSGLRGRKEVSESAATRIEVRRGREEVRVDKANVRPHIPEDLVQVCKM
jgi:hypothetical protein